MYVVPATWIGLCADVLGMSGLEYHRHSYLNLPERQVLVLIPIQHISRPITGCYIYHKVREAACN